MAKDKVITVMCAARLPEMLVKRMDAAAASGGVSRAQFIAEACRMRLVGTVMSKPINSGATMQGILNSPPMAELRAICAGELESGFTGIETIVKRDGTNIHQSYSGGIPEYPGRLDPECRECSSPMRSIKGKWCCVDVSCGMCALEQKA